MNTILIFTDASTSSIMNIAVGAFICIDEGLMQQYAECSMEDLYVKLVDKIVYRTIFIQKIDLVRNKSRY